MAGNIPCPVCGHEGASFTVEAVTLCQRCGEHILPTDARLLLVTASDYRTFCSPECLRQHQARDGLYTTDEASRGT